MAHSVPENPSVCVSDSVVVVWFQKLVQEAADSFLNCGGITVSLSEVFSFHFVIQYLGFNLYYIYCLEQGGQNGPHTEKHTKVWAPHIDT